MALQNREVKISHGTTKQGVLKYNVTLPKTGRLYIMLHLQNREFKISCGPTKQGGYISCDTTKQRLKYHVDLQNREC